MSFHNVGVDPELFLQVHVLMFGKITTNTHVQAPRHLHKIKSELPLFSKIKNNYILPAYFDLQNVQG